MSVMGISIRMGVSLMGFCPLDDQLIISKPLIFLILRGFTLR